MLGKRFGRYKQGRQVGNLMLKKKNIAKNITTCGNFLRIAHYLIQKGNREPIQMKAIYINTIKKIKTIWDPNNKHDVMIEKAKLKGCYYCFVAMI